MDRDWRQRLGRLKSDGMAGLVSAVVAIPDGLAAAAMVGVNPIQGLYASMVGPTVGGLFTSTQRMMITATSASALAAAEALASYPESQRESALSLLVVMIGGFLLILSLLRAGRLVRFVSHAVMTGFLLGVALVLVLSQLSTLVGIADVSGNPMQKFLSLLGQLGAIDPLTTALGAMALVILLALGRSRFANWAALVALVVPTLLALLMGWGQVETVGDQGGGVMGLVLPALPDLSVFSFELAGSAFAVAIIIAIQAAGVSQSAPNLDGSKRDVSRDMLAQGLANAVGGMISAIPSGGSVGQTALSISLGARTRWAGVIAGACMLGFLALVPHLVALVPMTVLAALMIVAGFSALNWREALSVWNVGGGARIAILVTFVACLVTSIPVAVGVGVGVTIVYYLLSSAGDVTVDWLDRREDGTIGVQPPQERLADRRVTVLDIQGSLYFAGARTLAERLPDPAGSNEAVVILRLHSHKAAGATLIEVLEDYARKMAEAGGALYLSGVNPELAHQLERAGLVSESGGVHVFAGQSQFGSSTIDAVNDARKWIESR